MNRYQQLVVEDRELTLYLPPSYHESDRSYPVAYVQDQGDMFTDCLNYLNHLFARPTRRGHPGRDFVNKSKP